jgi:hypothetical protein
VSWWTNRGGQEDKGVSTTASIIKKASSPVEAQQICFFGILLRFSAMKELHSLKYGSHSTGTSIHHNSCPLSLCYNIYVPPMRSPASSRGQQASIFISISKHFKAEVLRQISPAESILDARKIHSHNHH